ncbi:hypothetical protein FBU30_007591 [Linnemannia zychae]|nr:hypothetical protein FBU30_007591 [Linnemannia zychae]
MYKTNMQFTFTSMLLAVVASVVLAAPQLIPGASPVVPPGPALPAPPNVSSMPGLPDFTKSILGQKRESVPADYIDIGVAPGTTQISVTIGLQFPKSEDLVKQLLDISDPQSASYGHFLSAEALAAFGPSDQVVDLVRLWLKPFGIDAKYSYGYFTFSVTVDLLSKLFQAEYHIYKSKVTGEEMVRTLSFNIPSVFGDIFDVVFPGIDFDDITTSPKSSPAPSSQVLLKRQSNPSCNNNVTPRCLQTMYNIPVNAGIQRTNILSVAGFLKEYANRQDLSKFIADTRPDVSHMNPSFTDKTIDGGVNPQDLNTAGIEANLDIQYTVGLVNGGPVEFFRLSMAEPPSVVSFSYGFNENQVSRNSAVNLCNLFGRLGARGVSIIVASGDGGVAGSRPSDTCTQFVPTFPASCPYVTVVGATTGVSETGAGLSAGGFSNYFARPSYQSGAVGDYLQKLGGTYLGRYNPNGRAYPDISAQGQKITIAHRGGYILVDGTSASAPIFASIVALINDRRISKGQSRLGFLNLFIYSRPDIWNDISTGSNPSCGTSGFPAMQGFDCVTGMGTPNFARFAAAAGIYDGLLDPLIYDDLLDLWIYDDLVAPCVYGDLLAPWNDFYSCYVHDAA